MNPLDLFLRDHALVHDPEVGQPDGGFSLVYGRLHGLTEDQLRLRPEGWNSIAWILWHIARCEDVAVNVIVAEGRQVLDEGEWAGRLNTARRDIGTAMTDDEVGEFSRGVDVTALRAYRSAVGYRTRQVVPELPAAEWERRVDGAIVQRAVGQGAFTPDSMWVAQFWEGKEKAWFLYWLAAGHSYMHLGQATWIKEMILGRRGR